MSTNSLTIEGEIAVKMEREKISRKEALEDMLNGAQRGAFNSDKAVAKAQTSLVEMQSRLERFQQVKDGESILATDLADTEQQLSKLKKEISREGRVSSLEHQRVAIFRKLLEEEFPNGS